MPTEDIGELIRKCCYPAPYVKHPNINHVQVADKLFPYLKHKLCNFEEFMLHYQATYLMICKDFESYLAYIEEEHWNNFKNKHKMNNDRIQREFQ